MTNLNVKRARFQPFAFSLVSAEFSLHLKKSGTTFLQRQQIIEGRSGIWRARYLLKHFNIEHNFHKTQIAKEPKIYDTGTFKVSFVGLGQIVIFEGTARAELI